MAAALDEFYGAVTVDSKINVVLADDHPAILFGLNSILSEQSEIHVSATAGSSAELMQQLERCSCDVLVSDYLMPNGNHCDGHALFSMVRRRHRNLRIVVLTMVNNLESFRGLLKLGINCIISKSDAVENLSAAVWRAYHGRKYFSPSIGQRISQINLSDEMKGLSVREAEVIRLLLSGMGVSEIAHLLNRSKQTVSTQKKHAMRKLGLNRDVDLFRYGFNDVSMHISSIDQPVVNYEEKSS